MDVYVNGKVNRYQVTFDQQKQTRTFPCESKPDLVNFDGDKMLLCIKNDVKSDTAFAFQYNHAPKYLDRYEAVAYFRKKNSSSPYFNEIISKALNDSQWNIRLVAVNSIKSSNDDILKNKVAQLAVADMNSHVRAGALKQMAAWKDPAALETCINAIKDSSYLVIATALDLLHQLDSVKAYAVAQQLEKEKSDDIADAIVGIYASQAGPEKADLMLNKINEAGSVGKYQLLPNFATYLARNVSHPELIRKSLPEVYDLAENDSHWWLRFQAMSALVTIENGLADEKGQLTNPDLLDELSQKISEIKSKETDERLRSVYGMK